MLQSDKGAILENTTRWNNDVLMLAQRLRRWLNIIDHGFNVLCLLGCYATQTVVTSCLTSKHIMDIANMFNSFFQSVFNKRDINNKCPDVEKCKLPSLGYFQITIEEVHTILKSLVKINLLVQTKFHPSF